MNQVLQHSLSRSVERHVGFDAGAEAARAAWAAVGVSAVLLAATIVSVGLSALIAWIAVSGPNRERLTRDLEIRKARKRLDSRAAETALKALSTIQSVYRYVSTRDDAKRKFINGDVVDRYVARLSIRRKAIKHFLEMQIRDLELVNYLLETSSMIELVDAKICRRNWRGQGSYEAFAEAKKFLDFKSDRRRVLRASLRKKRRIADEADLSLQNDLTRIWSWRWFSPFERSKLVTTPRD